MMQPLEINELIKQREQIERDMEAILRVLDELRRKRNNIQVKLESTKKRIQESGVKY